MSVANDVLLQDDGKMIVAGSAAATVSNDMVLVRFRYDGSVDTQFGIQGTAAAGFPTYGTANGVGVQADAKLIVSGQVSSVDGSGTDIGLAGFGPKGALDLVGGGGADYLSGAAGVDVLTGDDRVSGYDTLAGGAGNDACTADAGTTSKAAIPEGKKKGGRGRPSSLLRPPQAAGCLSLFVR